MPSFGDKLRQVRESHDTTLEEIARTTKIRLSYLEALERNDLESLPGRAFGKFYIRAYAEVLGFDPRGLIEDYDNEGAERPHEAEEIRPAEPQNPWQEALRKSREEARRERRSHVAPPAEAEEPEEPAEADAETLGDPVVPEDAAEPDPVVPVGVPEPEKPAEEVPAEPDRAPETDATKIRAWVPVAGAALLILAAWFFLALARPGGRDVESTGPVADLPASTDAPAEASVPVDRPPVAPPAATPEPLTPPPPATARAAPSPPEIATKAAGGSLSVTESGVGRRVANHRLVGRDERFDEGDVVVFATRVLGGKLGDSIRHVWFREGRWMQTIELELGGGHWRTHSSKTLWGTGAWTVEARDAEGRVLARGAFACVKPGS